MIKFKNRHNLSHNIGGRIVWESRSVAVNCVVICGNSVLIGQRGKGVPDSVGLWNIPSGYMDWDESGTEAVYREVWEETGLYLPDQKIIINNLLNPWHTNTQPDENRQNISLRYGCVIALIDGDFPILTDENSEPNEIEDLKWVPFNELSQYKFAFNHDVVIKDYINLIGY
jgi:8-oxo-dGTP pyrophosphatase MutT (NUDIX family)